MQSIHRSLIAAPLLLATLAACNSNQVRTAQCNVPDGHNLDQAISLSKSELSSGCSAHFDSYFDNLLVIAEGDPKKENREKFSEFLVWANGEDLLSKRQARERYNRYFGLKFVSLKSEYSVCSQTCPQKQQVLRNMKWELADKERGLMKISADSQSYQQSDQLYRESELVLEATCNACNATAAR